MTVIAAHEAGHAIIAYHYGLEMKSLGINPFPHCLVSQKGASAEQVGVMLCAGAAAEELMYGKATGHYWDYQMAEEFGCVTTFTDKAAEIIAARWGEFCVIEQYLFGKPHPQALRPYDEGWEQVVDYILSAEPSPTTRWMLKRMISLQTRYPKLMAKMNMTRMIRAEITQKRHMAWMTNISRAVRPRLNNRATPVNPTINSGI